MMDKVIPKQSSLVEYLPELKAALNESSPPVQVFYRRVKSDITDVEQRELTSDEKKIAVINVINQVLKSAHKTKDFDDLELTLNRRTWIMSLLFSYPDIDIKDAQFLLNDFTYEMKSRMREEEKYGILLLAPDILVLCHSKFGEITITPDFEILPRMLDTDNVIRFVAFIRKNDGEIEVKYHEEYKTKFLMDWLGVSKKELYSYLGGKYRLESDINGVKIALELPPDELYKLLRGHIGGIKFKDGRISFEHPIEGLPITLIRAGKRPYKNVDEFIQEFMLEYFTVDKILKKYKDIINSIYTSTSSFKVIDDKGEVIVISSADGVVDKVSKAFEGIIPIFTTQNKIEAKESFLSNLATKLTNSERLRIFHPGDEFSAEPIVVSSLEIYNILKISDALKRIILSLNHSETGQSYIDKLLFYATLQLLTAENQDKKISFFLEKLSWKMLSFIRIPNTRLLLRKEDVLVEYKSREYLEGKDKVIIKEISDDLESKLKDRAVVIYYLGFDEKSRIFDGINMGRINDNRLSKWEEGVKGKTNASRIYFYSVPDPNNPRKGMVIMVAIK